MVKDSTEDEESASASTTDSEEESSSSQSETESSESSIEVPVPKKKAKKMKKNKPAKKLAKQAKKKGDRKSNRSIMEHIKEAQKVTSDAVGPEMEKELRRIESKMLAWEKKEVETEALQRFAARILAFIKEQGIICSVDHAIFQQEIGRIHLLEMDMVNTLNTTNDKTSLEGARNRANELLLKVFDSGANDRLERTLQGTTWLYGGGNDLTPNMMSQGKLDSSRIGDNLYLERRLEATSVEPSSNTVPALESIQDRDQIDWELQQDLNRKLFDTNILV